MELVTGWVVCLSLAWMLLWVSLYCQAHRLADLALRLITREEWLLQWYNTLEPSGARYFRGRARSLVYYCLASLSGGYLCVATLTSTADYDNDASDRSPLLMTLVFYYADVHTVFFTMGMTHWIWALYEDWRAVSWLSSNIGEGESKADLEYRLGCSYFILFGYTEHHILAASVYAITIATKHSAHMAVLGLIFELPLPFVTVRELFAFARRTDKERSSEQLLQSQYRKLRGMWCLIVASIPLGRLVPIILFLLAILSPLKIAREFRHDFLFGDNRCGQDGSQVECLDQWEVNLYIVAGSMFCCFTFSWLIILCFFYRQDFRDSEQQRAWGPDVASKGGAVVGRK